MPPQFPRPTHFFASLVIAAAALFLAACEGIPTSNTRYIRIDPVEHSGFNTDDLKQAFAAVYDTLDRLADGRFGPNSGNYQRIRRSVPVKVQMVGPSNHTPYQFDMQIFQAAELQQIRDTKGSLWTRYTASDPTRLRTAKTDWKLMFLAFVKLDRETSTAEEPRFYYQWQISDLYANEVLAKGKEPLRARNPAALRLNPETR